MRAFLLACGLLLLAAVQPARAQAPEGDVAAPDSLHFNQFDFGITTFQYGFGVLIDFATYVQDEASHEQIDMDPAFILRDMRLLLRGRIRGAGGLTWQTGLMYDRPTNTIRFRQTGLVMPLPKPWGRLFLGRTKEGVSLNKVMVGYYGWTMERYAFSDATLPILADGLKWYGYTPNLHLIWSVGGFTDWLAHIESFSKDEKELAVRLGWVPLLDDTGSRVLHLGINARVTEPAGGTIRFRARPESFSAPYAIDTGNIESTSTRSLGWEAYFQSGRWLTGTEYTFMETRSEPKGDPVFNGGDIFVSRLLGPGTRAYNSEGGGFFDNVIPDESRSISSGGPGLWELVLRFSYADLDDGLVQGGTFWRITPMANWHLSSHVRMEFAYGYGVLKRSFPEEPSTPGEGGVDVRRLAAARLLASQQGALEQTTGHTHFLQTRWQVQF